MSKSTPTLATHVLAIGYKSGKKQSIVAENLNLELLSGEMVCLLGPNGAGKSTLMRTLAGLQPCLSGEIFIEENSLEQLTPGELAVKLSLVLTEKIEGGNLKVMEVVAMGRSPYTGWLGKLDTYDYEKIAWALESVNISALKSKRIHQLSDGEKQKVMLARALAQDTKIILLDEPTAHLDLPSRVEMMHLLHSLARKTMKAILLSTHELDLALQAADQLWLMNQAGEVRTGVPEDLVLNGSFEATFEKSGFYFDRSAGSFTIHRDEVLFNVSLSGKADLVFWTKRALLREGIGIKSDDANIFKLRAIEENGLPAWILDSRGSVTTYFSLSALIRALH